MIAHKEENHSIKSWITSIVFHLAFLAICYFSFISIPFPIEETDAGGIIINYGTSEDGMNEAFSSAEEPSTAPNANNKIPEEPIKETQTSTPVVSENDNNVITQENEEAPEVKTSEKKNPNPTVTNDPVVVKEPVKEIRKADQNALYKGKKNNGTGTGDGNTGKPGNQGKQDGSLDSKSYEGGSGNGTGTGIGAGGVGLDLAGRKFLSKPVITDDGQSQGVIKVSIQVDKAGTIVSAKAGERGTTISNTNLWKKCEKAVLGVKLNSLETAPDIQTGLVTFTFRLQ